MEKNYNFEKRNNDESEIILDKIKKKMSDDVTDGSSDRAAEMTAEEVLEIQQLDEDISLLLWK